MKGEILSIDTVKELEQLRTAYINAAKERDNYKLQLERLKEIINNINEQYKMIPDKELLTNRFVDISVIEEINKILEEIE